MCEVVFRQNSAFQVCRIFTIRFFIGFISFHFIWIFEVKGKSEKCVDLYELSMTHRFLPLQLQVFWSITLPECTPWHSFFAKQLKLSLLYKAYGNIRFKVALQIFNTMQDFNYRRFICIVSLAVCLGLLYCCMVKLCPNFKFFAVSILPSTVTSFSGPAKKKSILIVVLF